MTYLINILLSGDYPELAFFEVRGLLESANISLRLERISKRVLRLDVPPSKLEDFLDIVKHAVLVKEVIQELFCGALSNFIKGIKDVLPAGKIRLYVEGRSFSVRALKIDRKELKWLKTPEIERRIGATIKRYAPNSRVDLNNPQVVVRVWLLRDRVIVGILRVKLKRSRFRERIPNKRPFFHPSALTPENARLLVNLTGARPGYPILDCFCGTGSILIEAALRGFYGVGIDIKKEMAYGARTNLDFYKLAHNADVIVGDACLLPIRDSAFQGLATDPPYGRLSSTKGKDVLEIYECFLKEGKRVLKNRAKCAFMHPLKLKIPEEKSVKVGFAIPVHRGLTRVIKVWVKQSD